MTQMFVSVFTLILLHSFLSSSLAALPPAPVPQTGQTLCYTIDGETTDCAGTGQDGEVTARFPWPTRRFRFLDNGDPTVTDTLTGLMWAKDANLIKTRDPSFDADGAAQDGAVTWQHALDYVKKLNTQNYLGHNDWRLPNRNELESVLNKGKDNSSVWLATQGLSNVQSFYWSSSTYARYTESSWVVYMGIGYVIHDYKGALYYVWPVRSGQSRSYSFTLPKTGQTICYDTSGASIDCTGTGQDGEIQAGLAWPNPRFVDNDNRTVTDKLTGLIWTQDANIATGYKTWQEALDYVKKLNTQNYLGYNDWRLPNWNELESMVNKGAPNSAHWLATQGFFNVQSNYYWSSTTYVYESDSAWNVNMSDGNVFSSHKSDYYFSVWPVRAGQ